MKLLLRRATNRVLRASHFDLARGVAFSMPTTVARPSRGGVTRQSRGGPSVAPPAKAGPSVAHVPVSDGVPITFFINAGAILYFTPKLKIEPAQRASMLITLELHGGGDPLLAASKGNLPRISLDDPDERVRADAWDEDAFGEGLLEHKILVSDVGRGQWWIAVYNFDGLEASRAHATLTARGARKALSGPLAALGVALACSLGSGLPPPPRHAPRHADTARQPRLTRDFPFPTQVLVSFAILQPRPGTCPPPQTSAMLGQRSGVLVGRRHVRDASRRARRR